MKVMIMPQQSSSEIKADWFADDLGQYRDQYSLNVLSAHKHVINFQVDRWPHLLMVADPELERGPATIGLGKKDFLLVSRAVHEMHKGFFNQSQIIFKINKGQIIINWRDGNLISFTPFNIKPLDYSNIHSAVKKCLRILRQCDVPSASAVLLNINGGDNYFRRIIYKNFPPLVYSLMNEDVKLLMKYCSRLVGLGKGLTPTGDDLIHGALIGYHYLITAKNNTFKQTLSSSVMACKTNLFGQHMIEMGCKGLTSEAVRDFILAINKDSVFPTLMNRILNIGASTGYDLAIAILFLSQVLNNDIAADFGF